MDCTFKNQDIVLKSNLSKVMDSILTLHRGGGGSLLGGVYGDGFISETRINNPRRIWIDIRTEQSV